MDYPEKELVEKIKKGDTKAFEELIMAYEKRIYNIAYRMMGSREDACDIAQEVCIKIYKGINGFKENSAFSTWIYRITSNVCVDAIRKREKTIPLTVTIDNSEEFEIPIENKDKLPDEIVEIKDSVENVRRCILRLPPDYRMVIVLRDIRGLSYEEMSVVLNTNLGTVKSRLNRARNMLRDMLKGREPFKEETV